MSKAQRAKTREAAQLLIAKAPRHVLNDSDEEVIDRYLNEYYSTEEARFNAINAVRRPNAVWKEPRNSEWNMMAHRIAAEMAVCEMLDIDYLPRHEWRERRDLQIKDPDVVGFIHDTAVKVSLRIPKGAEGVYAHIEDCLQERWILWAEVRLKECSCFMCLDASPRPETRVRLLGGIKGFKDLWYRSPAIPTHKNDKEHYVAAEFLSPPSELLDDDGIPLVMLDA